MAGSYGAEATQGERYRLSFTVGGLLASRAGACGNVSESSESCRQAATLSVLPKPRWASPLPRFANRPSRKTFLRFARIPQTGSVVAETTRRLSALTVGELAYLAGPDSSISDREALMWIAMCRYYAIVGEFAGEVLKKHYLVGNLHLDFEDYARFIANKATWHPELETISEGTAKKLRSNLFKAMVEAHLFDKNSDTVVSFLPSPSLADILMKRPDSFGFFPMRESSL